MLSTPIPNAAQDHPSHQRHLTLVGGGGPSASTRSATQFRLETAFRALAELHGQRTASASFHKTCGHLVESIDSAAAADLIRFVEDLVRIGEIAVSPSDPAGSTGFGQLNLF